MANWNQIEKELYFTTSRSSGAGGQHVNKVESKVRACFSIAMSLGLSKEEKELLLEKFQNRLNKSGQICFVVQTYRQQLSNKKEASQKMIKTLKNALKAPKRRIRTRVPKSVVEKRLKDKKTRSETKELRKKIDR